MAENVNPIPEGYNCVTISLVVEDLAEAIDFYTRAFGAREIGRFSRPDGALIHAEIDIGGTKLMLGPACEESRCLPPSRLEGTSCSLYVYVPDAKAALDQALRAGAKVEMDVEDMFWGDRLGQVVDPFGHHWSLATHVEDLSDEQMRQRAEEFFASKGGAR